MRNIHQDKSYSRPQNKSLQIYKDQSNTDISQVIAMMILKVNVYKALSIALQI